MTKKCGMILALSVLAWIAAAGSAMADPSFVSGWPMFFDGPGLTSDDHAVAIASAELRNVYVTGTSPSATSGIDIVTIKYREGYVGTCDTPACMIEWAVRYDSGQDGADVPVAIAVDGRGHVIVCGYSLGDGGNFDIVLIKYDGMTGNQIWEKRFDGRDHRADYPTAMVIEGTFIYVTGRTTNANGNDNIIVLKYGNDNPPEDVVEPTPLWARVFSGGFGSNDVGTCIAATPDEVVYVGGMVVGRFATLRYNTTNAKNAGQDWFRLAPSRTRNNNQARAIGVNAKGECFVTGDTDGLYTTIKYNQNGRSLWRRTYRGKTRNPDSARLLAVDPAGDVYVAGTSDHGIATIKYTGLRGGIRWINRYSPGDDARPTGMVLDAVGDVYVVGSVRTPTDQSNILVYKLDEFNGGHLWTNPISYNRGTGSIDEGAAIALDSDNNVCVTGSSCSGGLCDYTTIKYKQ